MGVRAEAGRSGSLARSSGYMVRVRDVGAARLSGAARIPGPRHAPGVNGQQDAALHASAKFSGEAVFQLVCFVA